MIEQRIDTRLSRALSPAQVMASLSKIARRPQPHHYAKAMSEYDTDFVLWSREQAELLRRMAAGERVNDQVDWENVAEEIESLGKSDRRDLSSRIETILRHLIKLAISPASQPRAGWKRTIVEQRTQIARLLKDSPGLRRAAPAVIAEELPDARTLALLDLAEFGEQPLGTPETLAFNEEQVFGPWLPD